MNEELHTVQAWASAHLSLIVVAGAAAAVLAALAWRAVRAAVTKYQPRADDMLTLAVAGVATAVAVSGMFRFFGVVLHIGGPERIGFAAVLELAVFAEAVRAKRNMADFGTAGQDGVAMWALAALSGVLAAWSAGSLAAAAFRLAMPLVAAWLWHRGLALARRRATGRTIHWRLTAERILVRLGLADPTEREASEVAAARRLTVLARAAKHLRLLRASGARGWRIRWATGRLDAAMTRAVELADLAGNPGRQSALLAQLGALYGASALADLDPPAPWDTAEQPAEAPHRADAVADLLADLAAELEAVRIARADLESAAMRTAAPHRADRTNGHGLRRADRTEDEDVPGTPAADRDAVVADLATEILTAAAAGEPWHPDYPALMVRTGRRKRWCESAVADARRAALGADSSAANPAELPARERPQEVPAHT